MAVEIRFNSAALASIAVAASDKDLRVRANRVLNAARRNAPKDKGTLAASIHIEYSTGPGGVTIAKIGSNLDYAIWRHEGTGIYGPRGTPIRPKAGKFLVFPAINGSGSGARRYKGGKTAAYIYARQVRGVKGVPFLLNALDAAK